MSILIKAGTVEGKIETLLTSSDTRNNTETNKIMKMDQRPEIKDQSRSL